MAESTDKRAVWLLDVDGVVNLIGSKQTRWPGGQKRTTVAGYPIRWAPDLVDFVNTVNRAGMCEVRWATTWLDDNLVDALVAALGFDHFASAYVRQPSEVHPEAKRRAACRVLDVGRRLLWTDDDAIPAKRRERIELLGDGEGDRWLTIAPSESYGLGPSDAASILTFLSAGSQDHSLTEAQEKVILRG
jgi:hypothetical protein